MATSLNSLSLPHLAHSQHKGNGFYLKCTKVRLLFKQMEINNKLLVIDTIQRLALDHHFAKEIRAISEQLHDSACSQNRISDDLYNVSLSFRLLRQTGFHVSQDLFSHFMNEEGKFKKELSEDTKGLLALYEASHLGLEGEEKLDEAMSFSTRLLRKNLARINEEDDDEAKTVKYSLRNPLHKSLPRLIANKYVEINNVENEWEILLQDLARMELTIVGSLFQDELLQVDRWWKALGLTRKSKSARSQPMKWHMWSMAMLPHPNLSMQRILLTKPISLVYIADDIFDLYGTLDQLTLFTQALKRWDISKTEGRLLPDYMKRCFEAIHETTYEISEIVYKNHGFNPVLGRLLPDYMKRCFEAIHETTYEISEIVYKNHGFNPLDTLKRSWEKLFDAFLREAKWFASGELPNSDEYLRNGIVSSGVPMVLTHLFFLIDGNNFTKQIERVLFDDDHSILYSVSTILRLLDDLGNAQDENQDGHDGSYIDCYMKEFGVSSYQVAKKHVMNMVSDTWKRINKQCLISSPTTQYFSPCFIKACLNVARMVPIMYNYDENCSLPLLQECVQSMRVLR